MDTIEARLTQIAQALVADTKGLDRSVHFDPSDPAEHKEVFSSLRKQGLEPSKPLQAFYRQHNPIDFVVSPWISGELEFVPLRELSDVHDGYAWDERGKRSDIWRGHWIIVALADNDPYFVHTGKKTLPVYTDTHGMGAWQPTLVASSLARFLAVLHQWYAHFPAKQVSADMTAYLDAKDEYGRARCDRSWTELLDAVGRIDADALPFWEQQRPSGVSKLHTL